MSGFDSEVSAMAATFDFQVLSESLASRDDTRPPLHLWQPELSGDIDIEISASGVWTHQGDGFPRQNIVTLFSRILCREGDEYFLKTPVEKWRIRVVDVPFYFVHLEVEQTEQGQQLVFISTTEDRVVASAAQPLRVAVNPDTQEPIPYLLVRDGMEGRLSRNVFYELAEYAELAEDEQTLQVRSAGCDFVLG